MNFPFNFFFIHIGDIPCDLHDIFIILFRFVLFAFIFLLFILEFFRLWFFFSWFIALFHVISFFVFHIYSLLLLLLTFSPRQCLYQTKYNRCGDSQRFFYMEVGRHSAIGAGELYMETEDPLIAQNMHTTIIKYVKSWNLLIPICVIFSPFFVIFPHFLVIFSMIFNMWCKFTAQCQQIEVVKNSDQWPEIGHLQPMKHPNQFWCDKHTRPVKRLTFHHRMEAVPWTVSPMISFGFQLNFFT